MIPLVGTVRLQRPGRRSFRIWIPVFLLWPFIIAAFLVLELLVIVAGAVLLFIWPRDALKIILMLPAVLYMLMQTAGLKVEIAEPGQTEFLIELT